MSIMDHLYSTRLHCYHFQKKSKLSRTNITIIISILLIWFTINEKYALKLIFEQECLDKKNDYTGSNCFKRTLERYTHILSEKDAALLNINIQSKCSNIIRLGNKQDGGWDICADDFEPTMMLSQTTNSNQDGYNDVDPRVAFPCIVYSFGINDDPSFDKELVSKWPMCTIYAFDPSIGRETGDQFLGPHIKFFNIGIGGKNETNERGWRIMTLDAIMEMLNHDHVNLLKIDVEGSEWATFQSWEKTGIHKKIGQLVSEIHFNLDTKSMIEEVRILKQMKIFDFHVFQRSDNFRWSRLSNVRYSEQEVTSIKTYRCIELGWRRDATCISYSDIQFINCPQ